MMCVLEAEMEVGSLIVSLDLTGVESVGNIYLPQTVSQECLLSCMFTLTFKVKCVLADSDELVFAWTLKSGYRKLCDIDATLASYPLSSVWESCWVKCEQTLLR